MTAATKINYYKMNISLNGRGTSKAGIIAKAIGAKEASYSAIVSRFKELAATIVPTVVEISGFENEYDSHKLTIDLLFKYLKRFQSKHRLVKFAVKIGEMRYFI